MNWITRWQRMRRDASALVWMGVLGILAYLAFIYLYLTHV